MKLFFLFCLICLPVYSADSVLESFSKYIEEARDWMPSIDSPRNAQITRDIVESTDPKLTETIIDSLKSDDPVKRAAAIRIASLKKNSALLDVTFQSIQKQVELIENIEQSIKAK